MFQRTVLQVMLSVYILLCSSAAHADWTRFRGPNGSGISTDRDPLPVSWSPTRNLQWKIRLPGLGSSSPIVVGDKVFVTCWSGYGLDRRNPGELKQLRRHLLCINRHTGKLLWSREVEALLPETRYRGMITQHGYASHTPVSDGQRVYVYFGKSGAFCFDMEGKKLWQTRVGIESDPEGRGSASSPMLYRNLLIVTATAESEALVGLDKKTGKEVWRQEAAGFNATWGTPVLVHLDQTRTDLVIAVPKEVWGLNPITGRLRWFTTGLQSSTFNSSVVSQDGIVYAVESGPGGGGVAVRAGGRHDVTQSRVLWSARHANRTATPILYQGRLYTFANKIITCIDAKTGTEIFKARLKTSDVAPSTRGGFGGDYASPVIGDGKIYYVARSGHVFVLKASDRFSQLAVNQMTSSREDFSATPAISRGQLFLRSSKRLYSLVKRQDQDGSETHQIPADPAPQKAWEDLSSQTTPAGPGRFGSRRGGRNRRGGFDLSIFFQRRDANGDGKLAGEEIPERLRRNLEEIDADRDGAVTLAEYRDGMSRMFRRRRSRGPGREESGFGRRDRREGRPERPQRPELEG